MNKETLSQNGAVLTDGIKMCMESAKRIDGAIASRNSEFELDKEKHLHSAVNAASTAVRAQVAVFQATK